MHMRARRLILSATKCQDLRWVTTPKMMMLLPSIRLLVVAPVENRPLGKLLLDLDEYHAVALLSFVV